MSYPYSRETIDACVQRMSNLRLFIDVHEKLITEFILPIADEAIDKAEQIIAATIGAETKPRNAAIEGAGLRVKIKGDAKALIDRLQVQMQDLETFRTDKLHPANFSKFLVPRSIWTLSRQCWSTTVEDTVESCLTS